MATLVLYGQQNENAFPIFKGLFKTTNKQNMPQRLKTECGPQKLKSLLCGPLHTLSPSSLGRQALVALHVASYLPDQGSNLCALHWKADS